jgi:hypothetical protein
LYTWRTASRLREPSQIDSDGEMGGAEPGLFPADGPEEPSSPVARRSLSEDFLSSVAGTGSGDWRRGSGQKRKSRLEKRLPEHFF